MTFPADIKGCMKDCILSLIWPKRDIHRFFQDHGCTSSDLSPIKDFKQLPMCRSEMVDALFSRLSARTDGGLGQYRAMLQSLLNWSHFDPYYFDKLRKLDRQTADKNLAHLRQLQEIRDAKILKEKEAQASAAAVVPDVDLVLRQLLDRFIKLHSGKTTPQKRGYALQEILIGLARVSDLDVTEPFSVMGEQIDGAIKFEGEHYLVEAKWQDKAACNEPVYQFAGKIDGKMYGRGMFVSMNGYSDNVIRSLVTGKAIKTIFVDGEDLVLVLEGHLPFKQMIDRKVKAAQTRGEIYVHPISGGSKCS